MMRVISSPSSSTIGWLTLILGIGAVFHPYARAKEGARYSIAPWAAKALLLADSTGRLPFAKEALDRSSAKRETTAFKRASASPACSRRRPCTFTTTIRF
jgi:hypothetical protein